MLMPIEESDDQEEETSDQSNNSIEAEFEEIVRKDQFIKPEFAPIRCKIIVADDNSINLEALR